MISITPDEIKVWAQLVYQACGIVLDAGKGYLLESRLGPLLRETASESFSELLYKVKADATRQLTRKVVDAMTTNETSFFRDSSPFELLQHKLLPELIDRRNRTARPGQPVPLRIWSAACSTGQEVYSIGIVIRELIGDSPQYQPQILGTDISDQALKRASYGVFTRMEMERGMNPAYLQKWFIPQADQYKIRDEVRALATFRPINLLEPLIFPYRFDIIFCRNVAIYFSEKDKVSLFDRMAQVLAPDGALIIGSTESITGITTRFAPHRHLRAVYYQPV
ncbi:MAG TPA: protein-glutamate O-methyltransferase CheR [Candidatus Ozemobacteraceae bacterium]|nr:protein-glutamate O-methyltransferase CheR [Candidatus Ozemobacteraceae bacterium]